MTRWLAGVAAFLIAAFALLLGSFRIPSVQAQSQARLDACAAPCWEGIQPGVTTGADALIRLTSASGAEPALLPCYNTELLPCELYQWRGAGDDDTAARTGVQVQQQRVRLITTQSPGLTLGDLLLTLRQLRAPFYEVQVGYTIDKLYLWLVFGESSVRLSAVTDCPTTYRDLMHVPVARLVLQEPQHTLQHPPMLFTSVRQTIYRLCEG